MRSLMMCVCVILGVLSVTAWADNELRGNILDIDFEGKAINVEGVKVDTSKAMIKTPYEGLPGLKGLRVGDNVEVEGMFSGDKRMMASKVEKKMLKHGKVEGKLDAINKADRTLTVSGIKISMLPNVKIKGVDDKPATFESLKTDLPVECEGKWISLGELAAHKVEQD
jgi:hypothetical protein